jgi:A/G-specific adenine glycosylase
MIYRTVVPNDCALNLWAEPNRCLWLHRRALHAAAIPSLMHKVVARALREA